MKIAFVYDGLYPYLKGGAERRYFELAQRLSRHHDVHYVTWGHWGSAPTARHAGFTVHRVGAPRPFYGSDGKRTIREAVEFALRLLPALRRERFDVIDCSATPYLPLYSCWIAARATRTPLVTTWHEFWGDHWADYLADRPAVARLARLIEAGSRPLGDVPVAVSGFTAGRLAAGRGGIEAQVVGNGISLDAIAQIQPASERSDIVFVGRLIEDKKVDVLLRALRLVIDDLPDVTCTIVGEGPQLNGLRALAASLGLETAARFAGQVEDRRIFALMKSASILAMPSIREGFGISVIEAQACGCVPIVARGPHTAAPDLVRDQVDGLVCDPTPESLARNVSSLLRDPSRLATMRAAARNSALQWDWDDLAQQMEAIYRQASAVRAGLS